MNIIEKLLCDKEVLAKYAAIDKVNPYPFNHGMKHIKNVVRLAEGIAQIFDLTDRDIEILKACEILHDLGQVDGRENHGLKAAEFLKRYLPKFNYFSQEEIDLIYSAVLTHDEKEDYSKLENDFSWFVNFVDKMDFARDRLEENYVEKFGYVEYDDIEKIDFQKFDGVFKIKIITIENPKIISEDCLFARSFFNKVVNTSLKFCEHFNLKLEMYLDEQKLDLSKMDVKKITS